MARALLFAALPLAGTSLAASPARAALTLCNRTSYILYAASAAIQSPKSETEGWTRIVPGDCQVARKEPLSAETYLVHARSSIAHSGPPRAWGGNYPICVKDGNFVIRQSVTQPVCTAEDTFALPFAPLPNRGKSIWTMDFDERPAMTPTQAQLAGVKRLLKDNGYPIAAINGNPDKATGAALADFRKRMHFAPDAGNAELFDVLEREARKKIAPAGYTVCNETREPLLAALGQSGGTATRAVSRGWWTVAAGACARLLSDPLNGDAFLLVQHRNGSNLVSGPRKFCTASVAFEIQDAANCSARGYAEAGFLPTPPRGGGVIAHVGPSGLKP